MTSNPTPTDADIMAAVGITDNRELTVRRATGAVRWTVNEFEGGESYLLIANTSGIQINAHFDAEQWVAFQRLVMGEI